MRTLFKVLALSYIIIALYYYTNETESINSPQRETRGNPKPDPNRKVHTFDWGNFRYVYKDEIPKEGPIKLGPVTSYPDLFIGTMGNGKLYYPDDIIIEGRYYELNILPTGDAELIPTR